MQVGVYDAERVVVADTDRVEQEGVLVSRLQVGVEVRDGDEDGGLSVGRLGDGVAVLVCDVVTDTRKELVDVYVREFEAVSVDRVGVTEPGDRLGVADGGETDADTVRLGLLWVRDRPRLQVALYVSDTVCVALTVLTLMLAVRLKVRVLLQVAEGVWVVALALMVELQDTDTVSEMEPRCDAVRERVREVGVNVCESVGLVDHVPLRDGDGVREKVRVVVPVPVAVPVVNVRKVVVHDRVGLGVRVRRDWDTEDDREVLLEWVMEGVRVGEGVGERTLHVPEVPVWEAVLWDLLIETDVLAVSVLEGAVGVRGGLQVTLNVRLWEVERVLVCEWVMLRLTLTVTLRLAPAVHEPESESLGVGERLCGDPDSMTVRVADRDTEPDALRVRVGKQLLLSDLELVTDRVQVTDGEDEKVGDWLDPSVREPDIEGGEIVHDERDLLWLHLVILQDLLPLPLRLGAVSVPEVELVLLMLTVIVIEMEADRGEADAVSVAVGLDETEHDGVYDGEGVLDVVPLMLREGVAVWVQDRRETVVVGIRDRDRLALWLLVTEGERERHVEDKERLEAPDKVPVDVCDSDSDDEDVSLIVRLPVLLSEGVADQVLVGDREDVAVWDEVNVPVGV